jgi:hypothetical protein
VQFVVDHGAKLDVKYKRGHTPLDAAMGLDFEVAPGHCAHESTAALPRKLMAVPEAKFTPQPAQ